VNRIRLLAPAVLLMLVVPLLGACGGSATTINVGAKDFTEADIIGEMYALVLEDAGFKVDRKFHLATTDVAQAAITKGDIDLYPEYTGTGLTGPLGLPPSGDKQQVYTTVKREYKARYNLVWLDAAPMNDSNGLATTQERAQALNLKTVGDVVKNASTITMVGPPEFQQREDGLVGMKKVYGDFQLKQYIAVQPNLKYQALINGQADVSVAFTTDGEIAAYKLVILQDDKQLFPPGQVAPVVRQQTLDANPQLTSVLNNLSAKLTDDVIRNLNNRVSTNKQEPAAVAKQFLTDQGLIKKQ
jgi:osmoprotectant transport system substrate-binding protein